MFSQLGGNLEQDEKQAFWRFTIRYNFLLLGGLYFLLLGFTISHVPDRMEGVINVWKLLLNLMTLAAAFGAWIYCIRKSWLLTSFDGSLRVATMAYLFGAPIILLFVTGDIIVAVMQVLGM
jgi:hypothetical protein